MVENFTIYGLINPVPGLPEAEQRALIAAKFTPKEWFVVGKDGDLDQLVKLMRPGRYWAVAHVGLLAEQRGNKEARVESMIAAKVAIHKRGGAILDVAGRRSDKHWRKMRRDGEELCRRFAQGRKSALNAKRGKKPYKATTEEKAVMREEWFSTQNATIDDAVARIKARLGKRAPGRTTIYKLLGSPYASRET